MGYLPGFATPRIVCDVPFVGKRWVHQVAEYDREQRHLLLDQELPDRHRADRPGRARPPLRVLRPGVHAARVGPGVVAGAGRTPDRVAHRCTVADLAGPLPRGWRRAVGRLALADAPRRPLAGASSRSCVPLTDDERRGLRGDARGVPPRHLAVLPVADRPGASRSARCGCRRFPPGPRRASGRASCATRSARTRTGRWRPSSTSTPTGCSSSRSTRCSIYCRHCTRRRITKGGEAELGREALGRGHRLRARPPRGARRAGLRRRPAAARRRAAGRRCSRALRAIPHVEMIRIGTRIPVTLPMRVTEELARAAPPARAALRGDPLQPPQGAHRRGARGLRAAGRPRRAGGEPDGADAPGELGGAHHQGAEPRAASGRGCGRTTCTRWTSPRGCEHLRTPLSTGVEILEQLRGHTTGLAVPHLAVDLPGGGGKVTLQPEYVVERRRARDRVPQLPGRAVRVPGAGGDGLQLSVRRGVASAHRPAGGLIPPHGSGSSTSLRAQAVLALGHHLRCLARAGASEHRVRRATARADAESSGHPAPI